MPEYVILFPQFIITWEFCSLFTAFILEYNLLYFLKPMQAMPIVLFLDSEIATKYGCAAVADLGILKGGFLITQTTKWEVVRICASQKRPFFFSFFHIFTFSVHISSDTKKKFFLKNMYLSTDSYTWSTNTNGYRAIHRLE